MTENVAKLGLVVDATGAQREIRLTREELVNLANGGKLAQQSIQSFQQPLTQTTVVAAGATRGLERLRGPLTQIAITASGIPGPLGRVASTLSQFAVGGGVTVAVLAGIGALSAAWDKYTESARKARDMMVSMHERVGDFSPAAQTARLSQLDSRQARLASELAATQDARWSTLAREGPIGLALNMWRQERLSGDLDLVTQQRAEVQQMIAERNREGIRGAGDQRRLTAQNTLSWKFDSDTSFAAGRSRWIADPMAGAQQALAADKEKNRHEEINALIEARRKYAGDALAAQEASIRNAKREADAIAVGTYELRKRLTLEAQKQGAKSHLGQWGISTLASHAGPFGGMVSGIGSGLMSGNPFMAAATGITGLIDGLVGMGDASREARAAIEAFRTGMESFVDRMRLDTGALSSSEFERAERERQYRANRAATVEAQNRAMWEFDAEEVKRLQEILVAMDANYEEWLDAIDKNTKALETMHRNAPRGFYVESYLGRMGRGPWEGAGPEINPFPTGDPRVTPPRSSASLTVNITGVSGSEQATAIVSALDRFLRANLGAGYSRSDALDLLPVS